MALLSTTKTLAEKQTNSSVTMVLAQSSSSRVLYAIILLFVMIVASFVCLLSIDQNLITASSDDMIQKPNASSTSGEYYYFIDNEFSFLQSRNDIDPSIEAQAQSKANANDPNNHQCSRIFLYLPDYYADHGHGSQINTYILAVLTATYLNRALLLLEPPMAINEYPGGSQFGCPVDAFREAMYNNNNRNPQQQHPSMSSPIWTLKNDFPLGLSRLIQHPDWLSRGCNLPCESTYQYKDWVQLYKKHHDNEGGDFPEITCSDEDGKMMMTRMVNVVASGGSKIRLNFKDVGEAMIQNRKSPEAKQWIRNLGGSNRDVLNFANKVTYEEAWDYLSGLMIRSGILKFQPWIARDVELFLGLFDLPLLSHQEFSAIHVRRGDKLRVESKPEVREYWKQQGHLHPDNYIPNMNYIPFVAYLDQWDGSDKCQRNRWGKIQIQQHNVYVATDDPVVVKQEVAALPNHVSKNTVLWNECYELTFYFSPADFHSFHLNGHHGGEEEEVYNDEGGERERGEDEVKKDNCFARYDRNIVSIADMAIAAKARTFIGEYNSNWGRLIRTMRVRLNKSSGNKWLAQFTKTLDTRVAWGNPLERPPGY